MTGAAFGTVLIIRLLQVHLIFIHPRRYCGGNRNLSHYRLHKVRTYCSMSSTQYQAFDSLMKGVVSNETVVLRRWGSSVHKFGFINGVDNVNK